MKRFIITLVLVLMFLFLVAFPGLTALITTSQLREDLIDYCQKTGPLVDLEIEMYRLYQEGKSDSIHTKAQMAGSDLLSCRPETKEVNQFYNRYQIIWDNWANDNIADLFGYGYEDNELIRYHEDILNLAQELEVPQEDLGNYRSSKWKEEKKKILRISKKYLMGVD